MGNYKTVTVANTVSRVFAGIIKKKKMECIIEDEGLASEEQNGFKKNRRGTGNIYILKEMIEYEKNKDLLHFFRQ